MRNRTTAVDVRRVALAALATALEDGRQEATKRPGLTGMRAVATGAVLYTAGRAAFAGRRFLLEHTGEDQEPEEDEEAPEDEERDDEYAEYDDDPDEAYEDEYDDEPRASEDEPEDDEYDDDDEPRAAEDELEDDEYDDDEPQASEDEDEVEDDRPRRPRRSRSPVRS